MLKVFPRPSLTQLGRQYGTDKAMPYHRYTPLYERLFGGWRFHRDMNLLEIGIQKGCSIRMWRDYFPHATIFCLDHHQDCVDGVSDLAGVHAHRLDATNWFQLDLFLQVHNKPRFDIIIDDGSHIPKHQWESFLKLHDALKPGGYYIVEDLDAPYALVDGRHEFIDKLAGLLAESLIKARTFPFELTFHHQLAIIKKGLR